PQVGVQVLQPQKPRISRGVGGIADLVHPDPGNVTQPGNGHRSLSNPLDHRTPRCADYPGKTPLRATEIHATRQHLAVPVRCSCSFCKGAACRLSWPAGGPDMTAPPELVLARACPGRCAGHLTAKGASWLQPDGIS